jgi:hypothetical protein
MAGSRATARDAVNIGKDMFAEAFERQRVQAPKRFPIRFRNLRIGFL